MITEALFIILPKLEAIPQHYKSIILQIKQTNKKKTENNPKVLLWTNEQWYVHTQNTTSATKRLKLLIYIATRKNISNT